jgi:hypothetical protein
LKDNDFRVCEHLLEVITRQEEVIARQNKLIAKLANENFEQENMINVLMQESSQLSDSDSCIKPHPVPTYCPFTRIE